MMDNEEFEKKKSLLVRNGLNFTKLLKETFKALLKYDWYKDWEYPEEFRKLNGSKVDPVDFKKKFLFKRIRDIISELAKYPDINLNPYGKRV